MAEKVRVFSGTKADVGTYPTYTEVQVTTLDGTKDIPLQGRILWVRIRRNGAGAAAWNLWARLIENVGGTIKPLVEVATNIAMDDGNWKMFLMPVPVGYDLPQIDDLRIEVSTDQNALDLDIEVCIDQG